MQNKFNLFKDKTLDFTVKSFKKGAWSIIHEFEKGLGFENKQEIKDGDNLDFNNDLKIPYTKIDKGILYAKVKKNLIKKNWYLPNGDWKNKIIIGAKGTGKNTTAENFVVNCNHGSAIIDSTKGESVDNILKALPIYKLNKTIVIDHSDVHNPVSVGTIKNTNDIFKNNELVSHWEDFFIQNFDIGDKFRTRKLIRYATKAVFSMNNMTILDVVNFVQSENFRTKVINKLSGIEYQDVIKYWNNFEELNPKSQKNIVTPFLNRVGNIEGDIILKTTLGQLPKKDFNWDKWIDENYTILIKIPEKDLPKEAVRIIVSLYIKEIWKACLKRGDVFSQPQKQFSVILDEPQDFLSGNTQMVNDIFSKARAYRLNMLFLFQSVEHIKDESFKLWKIILDNQPDIFALSYANIDGFKDFNWDELSKWHFLGRVNKKFFIGESLKPVTHKNKIKRNQQEIDKIINKFKLLYNRNYKEVLKRIERRNLNWEEGKNIDEMKLDLQKNGMEKMSPTESQKKTKEFSDSSITTNW